VGKKRKLRDEMHERHADDVPSLVICVGKHCCKREISRALVDETRAYAASNHPGVHVEVVGCLDVCKKGPVAATYPDIKFVKRVGKKRARKLVDKLARRHGA
jgi:(2Fe-2S) ferredoxin